MQLGRKWIYALRFILVAAAYALSYTLFRSISFSHWVPLAGLRLLWLIVLPYRYWPALILAELFPLAYSSYDCVDQFGLTWALFNLIPPVAVVMPIAVWYHQVTALGAKRPTQMGPLLLSTLVASTLWSVVFLCAYRLMQLPPGTPPVQWGQVFCRYFLGNFIGILTVTPLGLVVRETVQLKPLNTAFKRLCESRIFLDGTFLLLPVVALLTWIAGNMTGDTQQVARMAMFIPVAWLALKHGWRGAALGGSVASIAIVLTMVVRRDPSVLQAQAFIAFTVATLLMLGSRIASRNAADERGRNDGTLALQLARHGLYLGEQRMRRAAFAIEQLGASIQKSHGRLLDRLRLHLPEVEERVYYRQAIATQHEVHRLADSMYPRALRDRGLPTALREGAIARSLDEAGIAYRCEIQGRGLSRLAPSIHIALYRMACEGAIQLIEQDHHTTCVRLRLRGGETRGRRWALLQLDGQREGSVISGSHAVARSLLMPKLGANGLSVGSLRDQARVYGGEARMRPTGAGMRVSILLHDAIHTEQMD